MKKRNKKPTRNGGYAENVCHRDPERLQHVGGVVCVNDGHA